MVRTLGERKKNGCAAGIYICFSGKLISICMKSGRDVFFRTSRASIERCAWRNIILSLLREKSVELNYIRISYLKNITIL